MGIESDKLRSLASSGRLTREDAVVATLGADRIRELELQHDAAALFFAALADVIRQARVILGAFRFEELGSAVHTFDVLPIPPILEPYFVRIHGLDARGDVH